MFVSMGLSLLVLGFSNELNCKGFPPWSIYSSLRHVMIGDPLVSQVKVTLSPGQRSSPLVTVLLIVWPSAALGSFRWMHNVIVAVEKVVKTMSCLKTDS